MDEAPAPAAAARPTLRVIRGDATPEEIAAILAVVSARSIQAHQHKQRALRGGWNDRSAAMRQLPTPRSRCVALGQLDAVTRLLLASASPARLATLQAAGIDPLVQVSSVDEDAVLRAGGVTDPAEVPMVLARAKAEDVAARVREPLVVVGCDSILDLDGVALGKPADTRDAVRRWRRMRGHSAVLRTGHWVIDLRAASSGGSPVALGAASATIVTFADVTDAEIDAYVATGEPLSVAGAFTIDGLGGAFVTGVQGDHHGVVGISLPLVRELMGSLGVPWPSLWRDSLTG